MKYKIIVDKQSSANPSPEKKEYEIDIEELRVKGNVYDSLVITKDEDYVMRRLSLSEYQVLSILDEPIKQPLPDINIELFEGDNYIYLIDMEGNRLYAEYIVKNDFTDLYVTELQLNSVINQTASSILATVNGNFATKTELGDVNKSLTASLELKINTEDLISEINASADVIRLNAGRLLITSGNFQLDENGNIFCKNANISGIISTYSSNTNYLALRMFDTMIEFYDWDIPNKKIGSLATTKILSENKSGIDLFFNENGDYFHLGYTENDEPSAKINTVFAFYRDKLKDTPYIINTASGTLLGGIEIQNGLIKNWNMPTVSGNLFPDNEQGIEVKNGIITNWSFAGATGTLSLMDPSGAYKVNIDIKSGLITGWTVSNI